MTRQRAVILNVIRSDMHHLTADEIFREAKKALPNISRATVYNNLRAMEDEELIRRIGGEGASDRFDSNRAPHGHLFCRECGNIFDINVPNLEGLIARTSVCDVSEYELKVRGVCGACKIKSK